VHAPHAQRHRAARLRQERRDGGQDQGAGSRLAQESQPGLRLDLSGTGRPLQHRRGHRAQPSGPGRRARSLAGARFTRPGLLVTGEAAGSTYSFTGEGIGKAYETGLLAAEALLAAAGGTGGVPDGTVDDVCTHYEAGLAALQPRFALYDRANQVNAHPWLADALIWRANKSARLLRRMAGVLEETSNPGNLVSVRGFFKVLFPGK
jgi:hypothetical protein